MLQDAINDILRVVRRAGPDYTYYASQTITKQQVIV